MENVGQNSADAAENSGPDRPREEFVKTVLQTITELLAPLDAFEREQVLSEICRPLAAHYAADIFPPLTPSEGRQIQLALKNCGVHAASDRLHASWARHLFGPQSPNSASLPGG